MVDFWATWCGPCRMVAPIVEELADEYQDKGLQVGKLDVDSNPSTTTRFRVTLDSDHPLLQGRRDGRPRRGRGPAPHLEEKIKQHL